MEQLRIRLFGGLEVEGVESRATGSRKARTLVKVLTLARRSPVSVARLAGILWSQGGPSRPGDQVFVLVSRVRAAVGRDRLVRADGGYRLLVDWLDVDELAVRSGEAEELLAAGNLAGARSVTAAALALVRDDLLSDEPDPWWAETECAAAARLVASTRLLAADVELAAGRSGAAAALAEAALDHDPYDEVALRMLMAAHARSGRPASGLAAHARMRERLSAELGVSPAAETEAAHIALLQRRAPSLQPQPSSDG